MNIESVEVLGQYMAPYRAVAIQIAETFGPNCEVILHDLSHPQKSVVFVVNGHVTGRKVGQAFSDAMQIASSPLLIHDQLSNYAKTTKDGKTLKSSTSLIRNENGELVGALCINFDLGDYMQIRKFMDDMCKTVDIYQNQDEAKENENIISQDVSEILTKIISKVISDFGIPVSKLSKEEKITIVSFLNDRETFNIKGAVEEVAKQLSVSKFTIYNYIDEIKKRG